VRYCWLMVVPAFACCVVALGTCPFQFLPMEPPAAWAAVCLNGSAGHAQRGPATIQGAEHVTPDGVLSGNNVPQSAGC
jgi:hypothetical protein